MSLGEKVKQVRAKLRLTQKKLAEETGIPVNTIIKWENEQTKKPQMTNYGKFIEFCEENGIEFSM